MTPDQIFAVVAALLAGEPDPDFDRLKEGGYDDRYPVVVEPCELPPGTLEVEGQTLICGTVSVPENYQEADGRRVPLEFAILNARSMSPAPDPLIYLHGGPASGTLNILGPVADRLYANHRQTRDIVTFDQRAAALSASSVVCYQGMADHIVELVGVKQETLPQATLRAMVAPCVEEIKASGADLPAYNTENNARDVRALMSALGYADYNIYGISYGTKLALEVLRTAPDGVRSVIIDGVAPPHLKIYDDLVGPYADAMDALVDQCTEDSDCNAAYPDLRSTINAAFKRVMHEPIPAARGRAEIGFGELFQLVFQARNSWVDIKTITPYLPRILSELAEGKSDAYDAFIAIQAKDPVATLSEIKGLTADERVLVKIALETAEAMADLDESVLAAIDRLKTDLAEDRDETSVAEAFEFRSNQAVLAIDDKQARGALVRDYALLQTVEPSSDSLEGWITAHFSGRDRDDLLQLVAAMSEADLVRTFEIVDSQATTYEMVLGAEVNQGIYACQEDIPYNSLDGFMARMDELEASYPFMSVFRGETQFFDKCEAFEPQPRPEFWEPVVSDVPVLVLNGLLDVQTSWRWGGIAAETLTNARNYVIPEAGHGSIAYQKCPNDMSVAFLNDPKANINASCIDDIKIDFLLPNEQMPNQSR